MGIDRLSNLPDPIIHRILSFMDTKYAVRTSILSKEWMFHWRHIHSLNFDSGTDEDLRGFKNFVTNVLRLRIPSDLNSVRFHSKHINTPLNIAISKYAITHCIAKEFDTNATTNFPPCLDEECQTQLKTLKLGPCCISSYVTSSPSECFAFCRNIYCNPMSGHFPSLTTLQLYKVEFDNYRNDMNLFSNFSSLENLLLIGCSMKLDNSLIFNISGPRMTSLTISDFDICDMMRLEISAPSLKLFNLNGNPLWLSMKNCHQALEEVKIDLFQPPEENARKQILKEVHIFHLKRMTKGLCHTNSLRVTFTFSSKGKFLLYRNSHVIEVKFVDLKGTEEEWLPVVLLIVRGLGSNQLADELEENLEQKGTELATLVLQTCNN